VEIKSTVGEFIFEINPRENETFKQKEQKALYLLYVTGAVIKARKSIEEITQVMRTPKISMIT
jgi:hypothetical protein